MIRTIASVAALLLLAVVVSAAPPAKTVGILGDPSVIVVQGNETFTNEEIRDGLAFSPDFWWAAHPDRRLTDYTEELRGLLLEGYRHAGFPDVELHVTAEPGKDRILVSVTEGARFVAGEPELKGMDGPEAAKFGKGFAEKLAEMEWTPGQPATLDRAARKNLRQAAEDVFASLGRHSAKFMLGVAHDAGTKTARPVIDVENLGGPVVIKAIEVEGLESHTPEQVIAWLGLKKGHPADAGALRSIRERLEASGRFVTIGIDTEPGSEPTDGRTLILHLRETLGLPRLGEELPPTLRTLLRFREWLVGFADSDDEIHAMIEDRGELLLSPRNGLVLDLDLAGIGSGHWSLSLEQGEMRLVSHSSRTALRAPSGNSSLLMRIELGVDTAGTEQRSNLHISAGLSAKAESRGEILPDVGGPPAAFLRMGARADTCRIEEGRLVVETGDVRLVIDEATGRLISVDGTDGFRCRVTRDSFADIRKRIGRVPDDYLRVTGAESWIEGLLEFLLLDLLRDGTAGGSDSAILKKVFGESLREALASVEGGGERRFVVPPGPAFERETGLTDAEVLAIVLPMANLTFARGTWPREVAREATLVFAGKSQRMGLVLNRLYLSDEVGPLGHLTVAALLDTVGSPAAKAFAKKGLVLATPEAFERDVAVLVNEGGALGRSLQRLAAAVRGLSEEDRKALGAILSRQSAVHLRALHQTWEKTPEGEDGETAAAALRFFWSEGVDEFVRGELRKIAGE